MLKLRAGSGVVRFSILTSIALASLALGACGGPQGADPAAAAQSPPGSPSAAPTISGTPSTSVVAGQNYAFTPTTTNPGGMTLTFSIINKPSWATFSSGTGELSGTPASADVGTYANIEISVSDGPSSIALPAFSLAVTAPATTPAPPPTIAGSPATSIVAGQSYSFTPTTTDLSGGALTFSIANQPSWAAFSAGTGQLSGTPASANVGTYPNSVISVSDGTSKAALPAFTIAVSAPASTPPSPPTISGSPATSVVAGQHYSFTPTTADPSGKPLTFSISNQPSWATFSSSTGQLSGTPAAANVGTYANVLISVNDGTSSAVLPAFAITVTAPPPMPPTISGNPATSVVAGQNYSFTPTTTDPSGKTLTFSISNKPSWANFNAGTGQLSGTPTAANVGTYSNIMISVSDGTSSAALPAFTIAVTAPPPMPPTISGNPATSVVAGQNYSFTPTTTDPSGGTLTFSISNPPSWATFSASTGQLSGTPAAGNVGTYSNIVISVSDGTQSASLVAFSISVTAPAPPPPSTSWLWGVTTDDSTVQTASQVSAVAAFSKRVTIRTVFDPPVGGSPAATDYLSSVQALSAKADVMGLPVDSSAMSQLTTAAIGARIGEYIAALGPYVRIWEIGNEVNGNWLGQDVITKIETMYDAAKAAGKLTALTLYYENPATPGYEMISWVDQNIPPGHRMRSGLDYVLVSYYEDQNAGHQLTQSELDTMFSALAARFTSASLGFGECGWGGQIPSDNATRAALIQRFYGYRVPSVPRYIGGGFYWHLRQTMVPNGTPDWTVLQSLMSTA